MPGALAVIEDEDEGLGAEIERQQAVEAAAERKDMVKQQLAGVVDKLQTLADQQVQKKTYIEDRWYKDLRAYNSRYDPTTEANLNESDESRLFIGLTRSKTNAWEARLSDMLFPTDDKNWGIDPTPVPELINASRFSDADAEQGIATANQNLPANPAAAAAIAGQTAAKVDAATKAAQTMKAAKMASDAMETEIDDQLTECDYNVRCREVIHDACKLGTGIAKGPVVKSRMRRKWAKNGAGWSMEEVTNPRPEALRVDPWGFFPDMSATRIDQCSFFFERHLMTEKDLRALSRKPGFDKDKIRELIRDKPREGLPTYLNMLRDITNVGSTGMDAKYQVWEYYGPLEADDVRNIAAAINDEGLADALQVDELEEISVVMWFCQGKMLKIAPHPLDSEDPIYSAFPFEKDDTNIFGFGVPYLMRDSQSAMNAAWRMIMDNGGLAVAPQIIMNKGLVEPADGNWEIKPKKIWLRKSGNPTVVGPAFESITIPCNEQYLVNIVNMARQFADDETNLPLIAHGESASHITSTAQGMSMLMNSVNVVFRRVVKNFDDGITTPIIRRFYDWNMQFNKRDDIKGDCNVKAKGSSVLLVREMQIQNLMIIVSQFSTHPALAPYTDVAAAYRLLVQAMMLNSNTIVKSDDVVAQEAAERAKQPPEPTIEEIKAKAAMQQIEAKGSFDVKVEEIKKETRMMEVAMSNNLTIDEIQAKLADKQKDRDSKERGLAVEAAVAQTTGQHAGGSL